MTDSHDVIVKVGLTADQFLWLRDESEALGLSHSAYLRQLVQQARRHAALNSLSDVRAHQAMPDLGLNRGESL
jgi:hypothetical protein